MPGDPTGLRPTTGAFGPREPGALGRVEPGSLTGAFVGSEFGLIGLPLKTSEPMMLPEFTGLPRSTTPLDTITPHAAPAGQPLGPLAPRTMRPPPVPPPAVTGGTKIGPGHHPYHPGPSNPITSAPKKSAKSAGNQTPPTPG